LAQIQTFLGNSTSSIDEKGRTSLPKEFRQYLPEDSEGKVVVTIWENRTLQLFPIGEWNAFLAELAKAPRNSNSQRLLTLLSAHARESKLDNQNRITLTEQQRNHAGLSQQVTFAANGRKVTLIEPKRFDAEMSAEDIDILFRDELSH
jgi:division/cell wall cluster transcriptional repressor MraZ